MSFNLNLDDRQRKIALFGGAGVAVLLFVWIVVLPKFGVGGLDSTIDTKESELREMVRLYQNFEQIKSDVTLIEKKIARNESMSLLSELSAIADKVGITQGIDSMVSKQRPKNDFYKEEAVEIRLQKINLEELGRLLYEIEHSTQLLRVRKLHVESRFDDNSLLNVTVEVSTFKEREEE
ncbi:MAG: hypothetical protein P9L99_06450 [Candidatus Lernaella stagnicola]|nr:hypothetical protein [Candidatus Lernaella stagnicola]